MTHAIVEELVTTALGLSGPEAIVLKVGVMVVSDLLKRPQLVTGGDPAVLSSTPGRVRMSAAGLKGSPRLAGRIEERVGQLAGVTKVAANSLTGTVLVTFDPELLDADRVSKAVRMASLALRVALPDEEYPLPQLEVTTA
jgi:copper chaperone CopZ